MKWEYQPRFFILTNIIKFVLSGESDNNLKTKCLNDRVSHPLNWGGFVLWKDVVGYEGLYQISNLGSVKSFLRSKTNGKIFFLKRKRTGYQTVRLYKNKKVKEFLVHRLVCCHFIDNPENKKEVNHKNGIKADNNSDNLEWASRSENMIHANITGLQIQIKGELNKSSKLTEKQAVEIKYSCQNMRNSEIAKFYKISPTLVFLIKKGVNWPHI